MKSYRKLSCVSYAVSTLYSQQGSLNAQHILDLGLKYMQLRILTYSLKFTTGRKPVVYFKTYSSYKHVASSLHYQHGVLQSSNVSIGWLAENDCTET